MKRKYLLGTLLILSILFASFVSFAYVKDSDVNIMGSVAPSVNITFPEEKTYNYSIDSFNWVYITQGSGVTIHNCFYELNGVSSAASCTGGNVDLSSALSDSDYSLWFNVNYSFNSTPTQYRLSSSDVSFKIDTIPPQITIDSPLPQNYLDKVDTINYTLNEANIDSCWFNNGTTDSIFNCSLGSITVPESPEGENNWTICVNDTVGHENCSSVTFFVDSIYPLISFNPETTPEGSYSQDYINVSITASDNNLEELKVYLYDGNGTILQTKIDNYVFDFVGLADGIYKINASAVDRVGHYSWTETRTITLDSHNPLITLNSPDNNQPFAFDNNNISFSYDVTDFFTSVECNLSINSMLNQTMSANTTLNPNIFIVDNFANGKYDWYIQCQDSLLNSATSETRTFTVLANLSFPPGTEHPDLPNEPDISSVWFYVKNEFGIINWTVPLDLSRGLDWAQYISLLFNHAEVDSINAPELNTQAEITLFNLTWTTPQILKDGILCTNCIMNSYENGTINFNAPNFSTYETQEKSVPSSGISGGTSCRTNEWICSDWSECLQGIQVRTCELEKSWCKNKTVKPIEIQDCIIPLTENETVETIEQPEEIQSEENKKGFLSGITGFVTANIAPIGLTLGVIVAITLGYLAMSLRQKKVDEKIKEEISKQSGIKWVSKEKK